MSRIQDILAKAERDGTTRTTQPTTVAPSIVTRIPIPLTDSVLDTTPSIGPAGADLRGAPMTDVAPALRTATATLHPALVSAIAPHSNAAERYRSLRARIAQREELSPARVMAITSAGEGEGKSITAANLALTMAQERHRNILLVDANLRTPVVHSLFAIDDRPGLSDVLSGAAALDDALVFLPELRLTVLPAGAIPEYPAELLGSSAMRRVLDTLRTRFDRIVLDLPAVIPLADVGTVAPMVDGALVVVRVGTTQRPALDQTLAAFDDQKVLGVVLNETH